MSGATIDDSPLVTENRIYVGNAVGVLYAIERMTGETVWQIPLDQHPLAHLYSSPVMSTT